MPCDALHGERSVLVTDGNRPAVPAYLSVASSASDVDAKSLNRESRPDLFWILLGLYSAVFLIAFDGTVVAALLVPIGSYFEKSNQVSYIGTAYLLSTCCFSPLYGRLSDILGRKGAMLLGLSLFGSGTILCGLAPSMEALIAARVIAGMGGGGLLTGSSIAITDLISLKQRGLYQGFANILFGIGAGLGGPLGGWMSDSFGWRSAFLSQIPILVFSFVLVMTKVDIKLPDDNRSASERLRHIDFMGSSTLVGAVGCLLLGFSLKSSEELPWSHPLVLGLFIGSCIFAVTFAYVEGYVAHYPVMPLQLISRRTPLFVSLSLFFGHVAAYSLIYNLPMYFSAVRLYSAKDAGLHLLPYSISISFGSVFAGWFMRRTGTFYFLTMVSASMSTVAMISLCFWNANTSQFHLWLDIIPNGFGMASIITTTLIAMITSVAKEDFAIATGITYLFRTTGQVIGVSLSGAIQQAELLRALKTRIVGPNADQLIESIRHSTSIISTLEPDLQRAAIASYARALRVVFTFQAACSLLCFIFAIPIQENPMLGSHEEQEAQHRRMREAQD